MPQPSLLAHRWSVHRVQQGQPAANERQIDQRRNRQIKPNSSPCIAKMLTGLAATPGCDITDTKASFRPFVSVNRSFGRAGTDMSADREPRA